jgi:hypothetical protein
VTHVDPANAKARAIAKGDFSMAIRTRSDDARRTSILAVAWYEHAFCPHIVKRVAHAFHDLRSGYRCLARYSSPGWPARYFATVPRQVATRHKTPLSAFILSQFIRRKRVHKDHRGNL